MPDKCCHFLHAAQAHLLFPSNRRRTVQLLPILLETRNHLLTALADQPIRKFLCSLCILHGVAKQEPCGVQERVVRFIGRGFVDDRLARQVRREREIGAAIREGVFLEEDRGG